MTKDLALIFTDPETGNIRRGFNSGTNTKVFYGVRVLLQKITKILLTPIGTDHYTNNIGTSFSKFMAMNGNSADIGKIESEVITTIGYIEDVIRTDQAMDDTLTDEERLVSINLGKVSVEGNGAQISITLYVETAEKSKYLLRI